MSTCDVGPGAAYGSCLVMSLGYVGSLYLVPQRISRLHRDHPAHIRARLVAVGVASSAAIAAHATLTLGCFGGPLRALGVALNATELASTARALGLTCTLYLGVFAKEGFAAWCEIRVAKLTGGEAAAFVKQRVTRLYDPNGHVALRNYVVAPATEELVFRGCMVPLLVGSKSALRSVVFGTPLFFGVAHLHHLKRRLYDEYAPLEQALLETIIQFSYTYLFGIYTSFIFARTGCLSAAVACHVFCNVMGLPDLSFVRPPVLDESCGPTDRAVRLRLHAATKVILATYLVGIGLFVYGLFPLTDVPSPFWILPTSSRSSIPAERPSPSR